MKLLLVLTLCAIAAATHPNPKAAPIIEDHGLRAAVLWYLRESAKLEAERNPGAPQKTDENEFYIPGVDEASAEDIKEEAQEDEDALDSIPAKRQKRSEGCEGGLLGKLNEGTRISVLQRQISRFEGIRDLFNYKKGMFRQKVASRLKVRSGSIGEQIAQGNGLGFSHAVNCCPDLPCCSYKE